MGNGTLDTGDLWRLAHGGDVSAESTLGEGTTVRVVLPR